MNQAFVLLGTNLGNKLENLGNAIAFIEKNNVSVVLKSAIYSTSAWGNTEQEDFLNQVIQVQTNIGATELLRILLAIENQMGRIRHQKWEARIIDLDILFFNNDVIDTPDLKIPHPYLHVRNFTLVPLAEIAPNFLHPIFKKSSNELLINCPDNSFVSFYKN